MVLSDREMWERSHPGQGPGVHGSCTAPHGCFTTAEFLHGFCCALIETGQSPLNVSIFCHATEARKH